MLEARKRISFILLNATKLLSRSSTTVTAKQNEENSSITAFVPKSNPASNEEIEKLQHFIDKSSRMFILTGAGISTESGIPDYRSKDVGLYDRENHRPMEHSEFISSAEGRRKYWARNYIGWQKFGKLRPNLIHSSLADWERRGKVYWIVTQNVDALHTVAGAQNLTELHGCLNRVLCLDCGEISSRDELQSRLNDLNPDWTATSYGTGPDADEFLRDEDVKQFKVASCQSCDGRLKPDVVFFGDSVNRMKVQRAFSILSSCDSMLVLGSSLHVWSGYRFILRAKDLGLPIACVNIGPTRADDKFELKVEARCSDMLRRIVVS